MNWTEGTDHWGNRTWTAEAAKRRATITEHAEQMASELGKGVYLYLETKIAGEWQYYDLKQYKTTAGAKRGARPHFA